VRLFSFSERCLRCLLQAGFPPPIIFECPALNPRLVPDCAEAAHTINETPRMPPRHSLTQSRGFSPFTWEFLVAASLGISVFAIYLQVGGHRPIPFDDSLYLTSNAWVQGGLTWEGVVWAFTNVDAANWHPVTWLSHMVDQEIYGATLGGHMIENVFWHWGNSFLVYCLLGRLGIPRVLSFSLALVFACHPLNVESTAWLSQRKNQVSTYMLIGAIVLYLDWRKSGRRFTLCLLTLSYAVSLMAKAMGVSLPLILTIYEAVIFFAARPGFSFRRDRQELQRWFWVTTKRMLPFVMAAGGVAAATLVAQKDAGAVASIETISLLLRFANAFAAIGTYLRTFFLPAELCMFYPIHEQIDWSETSIGIVLVLIGLGFAGVWARRAPLMVFGYLWFLVSLLPVIGLVQVGSQSHADRYMYVPMIGLLIMLGDLFRSLSIPKCRNSPLALAGVVMAFGLGMGGSAYNYVTFWRNPETAYRRSLEVGGISFSMLANLTATLVNLNYFKTAEAYAQASVRLWPDRAMVVGNLASLQAFMGKYEEAEQGYRRAIRMEPENVEHRYMLALTLLQSNKNDEAEATLQTALPLIPAADDWRASRRMIRAVLLREIPTSALKLHNFNGSFEQEPGRAADPKR